MQFLKSEADLEYIERRLKLDFISTAENGCPAEVITELLFFFEHCYAVKDRTPSPVSRKLNRQYNREVIPQLLDGQYLLAAI